MLRLAPVRVVQGTVLTPEVGILSERGDMDARFARRQSIRSRYYCRRHYQSRVLRS
jgi:hypothetical protein